MARFHDHLLQASAHTLQHQETVGDGVSAEVLVRHQLGTRDVSVTVFDRRAYETVECTIHVVDADTVRIVNGHLDWAPSRWPRITGLLAQFGISWPAPKLQPVSAPIPKDGYKVIVLA